MRLPWLVVLLLAVSCSPGASEPTWTVHPDPQVTRLPVVPHVNGFTAPSSPRPSARAARSRLLTGVRLDVTMYCWTGNRTSSGVWPQVGMAAGNRWPFGTRIRVPGRGVVVVTDRIGHGSDLDLYGGREGCQERAIRFGRQRLPVQVLR